MNAYDRTGEPIDPDTEDLAAHKRRCSGWLTDPDDDEPRPCLRCKEHLITKSHLPDYGPRTLSARARDAIEKENRNA